MRGIASKTRQSLNIGFRTNRYLNALYRLVNRALHRVRPRGIDDGDWGFANVVRHETDLVEIMGRPRPQVLKKVTNRLDSLCQDFIRRSPFIMIGSHDAKGNVDVSPKGDPAGFVQILDDRTLAIPERPGNLRADTFRNMLTLRNPKVGLIFIIPGKSETLRICGPARIVRDLDLREKMALNGKTPELALVVRVEEAFFHCAKSMVRSRLWDPAEWRPVDGLPSLADAMVRHGKLKESVDVMASIIDRDEKERLYQLVFIIGGASQLLALC
ncbi:MAG TPA: MSMEG_1061 family FMN-dependent PPOX-type flavoprotein [Alphaproteobacteria bacterium]